jgi:hypothetical protein
MDRALVFVQSGTANGGTTWMQPASGVTIGTTATTWQRSPLFGLRDSVSGGPVSVAYSLPLSGWYDGACTVTQGGQVVTGTTPFSTGNFTVDNGLLQLEGDALRMATGSPLAWGVSMIIGTGSGNFSSPSLLVNTPDMVVVRYRLTSSGVTLGTADMSMMRGSRTLTLAMNLVQPNVELVQWGGGVNGGFDFLTVPEAGSGIGYRSSPAPLTNMQYATTNDTDGNRRGLSYAGQLAALAGAPSIFATATAKRSHVFGLHAIVGGGTTKTGAEQLYGMDRAWFAMLAQQTSAGVL